MTVLLRAFLVIVFYSDLGSGLYGFGDLGVSSWSSLVVVSTMVSWGDGSSDLGGMVSSLDK